MYILYVKYVYQNLKLQIALVYNYVKMNRETKLETRTHMQC